MSFSQKLAGKYVIRQKRHSVFTLLSITAAVLFITVIFSMFASYWDTMKNAYREKNPWHAEVWEVTEEEIELFRCSEYVTEIETETIIVSAGERLILKLKFSRDISSPGLLIREITENASDNSRIYSINYELLDFELIGTAAKARFVIIFAMLIVFVLIIIACARFIIDTAFEISSKERETQFGILASLGASRSQIVRIILWEGIYLSFIAIPVGIAAGLGISYGVFDAVIKSDVLLSLAGVEQSAGQFSAPPLYIAIAAVIAFVWVMLSAYGTGMRFAKKPPVEVIRRSGEKITRVNKSRILGRFFGIEGTLASRNVRRNKKRFAITVVSIALSFVLAGVVGTFITYTEDFVKYLGAENTFTDPAYHYGFMYNYETVDNRITAESIKEGYDLLNSSGYFKAVNCGGGLYSQTPKDKAQFADEILEFNQKYDRIGIDIQYYNEDYYNYSFGGNPPVPYSELIGGNYVVCGMDYVSGQEYGIDYPIDFEANGSFSAFSYKRVAEDELSEADREIAKLGQHRTTKAKAKGEKVLNCS